VETLLNFTKKHSLPIVKTYEIEHAVICFIVLTDKGAMHLDVAITPYVTTLFTVDLLTTIKERETTDNIHILTQQSTNKYCADKKRYKKSWLRKLLRKLGNSMTIIRRLKNNTIITNGALIYIPFVNDVKILSSTTIQKHCARQIKNYLLSRYK